jgi:hypothetical protein
MLNHRNVVDDTFNECLVSIPDTSVSNHPEAKEHPADIERIGKLCVIAIEDEAWTTLHGAVDWTKDQLVV